MIDPDSRDDPSVQNPEKAAEMLAHQRKELSKMFPGIDTENGPAINEHCIYTVSNFEIKLLFFDIRKFSQTLYVV